MEADLNGDGKRQQNDTTKQKLTRLNFRPVTKTIRNNIVTVLTNVIQCNCKTQF